jgi:predicted nucleotide-binding protein (sugar kinase/HSP70/actin superfamily)
VDPEERWRGVGQLVEVLYWTFEDEFVGAAESLMQQGVDGIITISAFGCAPDSVMMSVVGEAARRARIPYMSLILDEHTGEAGLVTRLEAFVDMLARRTKTH